MKFITLRNWRCGLSVFVGAGLIGLCAAYFWTSIIGAHREAPPTSQTSLTDPPNHLTPPRSEDPAVGHPDSLGQQDDLGCWVNDTESAKFGPVRIGPERYLSTVCETMFVKDLQGRLIWQRRICGFTDSPTIVGGELVFIANDLCLGAVDPETGEIKWKQNSSGRAGYVQLVPYLKDMYLVLIDMSGYDDPFMRCSESPNCRRTEEDRLVLQRKDEMLDRWSVPAGSKIEVRDRNIFVSYKRGNNRVRLKIK